MLRIYKQQTKGNNTMAWYRLQKQYTARLKTYRGFFKYSDSGKSDVDLGNFTRPEEGLAWTRVYQMLVNDASKTPPNGKVGFVQW